MTTDTREPRVDEPSSAPTSLLRDRRRFGDSLFKGVATGSGTLILIILAAVATFLVGLSIPALTAPGDELPYGPFWSWVFPYAAGTVWAAALAMLFAVPVAIGVALFITHFAPRRLAQGLGYIIDLLAAVPSVVFGLWGINVLAPMVQPIYGWLNSTVGSWPVFSLIFGGQVSGTGRTILTVALVLAVMCLPIITAVTREVFLQTPRLHEEASLALGATRWEMIRQAVLPFGTPGLVSACMLGLGRALGETMAVAMVLSPGAGFHFQLLTSSNPNSIAANIALQFPEAFGLGRNQLIASGLVLFVITLIVNMAARAIVARRAEFSGAN
ncbi:phosphate ABC transporter membrane protein 1, PhoT family [Tessaracoccus bendigoensis DSM 12906]|uniref:Phosphate transport system permease protein n=1 Tax=Tessaracoccus bendigoensis DSM 12906 TaxID=1123357 RepID=A0A1M6E9U9_9ACTN|nr:phosphate ABC transporter permease subunit PstC [Tessaracoccus bendigoensis]SHI82120.1 phosphate ABC transporter membrane protein 1, PhoT family [Tessaracoccus bendigoensis DSM 12906]